MMENAGLPSSVILRVLAKPQRTRSSDWTWLKTIFFVNLNLICI
jgi:hypothetical protein